MAHTYDLTTDRGFVRLKIGDTVDRGDESLTDDEVDKALALSSDTDVAAVYGCQFLIAKLRVLVSQNAKGVTSQLRERVENTKELLGMLKEEAGAGELDVHFEGISKSDNAVHDADSDFTKPDFSIGQDDNIWAQSTSENESD